MAIFVAAFFCAATIVFGASSMAGTQWIAEAVPLLWRTRIAAAALGALAILDFVALRRDHVCPLTLRRQTPKILIYRHSIPAAAAAWGFDTGLAVTTFRVAATTWGALLLALFGMATWWWSAFAYAAAFTVPLALLMRFQPVENIFRLTPARRSAQWTSAVLLLASGALLAAGFRG